MRAGAFRAVIGTAFLGALVLAPAAEASAAQPVSPSCTIEYDPSAETIGGGPYIGDTAQDLPSYASVSFEGGTGPCTAKAEIR